MLRAIQAQFTLKPGKWPTAVILLVALFIASAARPAASDSAGLALAFQGGGNRVLLNNMSAIMGGTDWASSKTISVWVKPTAVASPVTSPTTGELIIGTHAPRTFGITRANYNGQDKLWLWNSDGSLDYIGLDFTPGQWTHIALVHANGLLTAYQDGQFVASVASGPTILPLNGTLYLGGNSNSQYFQGQIDEVRLWNAALPAHLIADWRYQTLTSAHPHWADLAAYYQMSDGAGLLLSDDSGNGHTGQLSGGMGDANWVSSDAFGQTNPTFTPTAAPTETAVPSATPSGPTPTAPPTQSPTNTPVPPTATPTQTPPPPSPTPSPPPPGDGYALQFDGNNDFVELHATANMLAAGWEDTKTVSMWVKPTGGSTCTGPTPAHCDAIFGDRARWWGISRGIINGQDRIWFWNYDGNYDQIGVAYALDTWVHLALVHHDGLMRAIINGVEVASIPSGSTLQPNTGAQPVLHIGGIINTSTRNWTFAGQIDEVRLWNVARNAAEISASMNQPLNGNEPGLAAYYRMSDGSGLLLSDDSGSGWHGTLFDGARGVPPDGQPPLWVSPGAISDGQTPPTPTATQSAPDPTATPTMPPATATPTTTAAAPTPTATVGSPSPTPTATTIPPSPTATTVPPSPTATATSAPPSPTATQPPPTATATPGGALNYALQFDGLNDYVALGDTGDLFGTPDWINRKVVSVWVQPTGAVGPVAQPASGELIVGSDRPRNFGITRAVYEGGDRLWVWNVDADGVDGVGIEFTPGEWLHVALVHENGLLSAYKNGQFVGSVPSGPTYVPNHATGDGQLYLGGSGRNNAAFYFSGSLDEVRFWNVAFSGSLILDWAFQELTTGHPYWADLSAYYQMSDGLGSNLSDDSGRGNVGQLHGGMGDANWVSSGAFSGVMTNRFAQDNGRLSPAIIFLNQPLPKE